MLIVMSYLQIFKHNKFLLKPLTNSQNFGQHIESTHTKLLRFSLFSESLNYGNAHIAEHPVSKKRKRSARATDHCCSDLRKGFTFI